MDSSLVLDYDEDTLKSIVSVNDKLKKVMKPHQENGVKFMWDSCFGSKKYIDTEEGSGCILAHCMGLGKTLQVIALIHTILKDTKLKCVMVICPKNTIENWADEFNLWLKDVDENIKLYYNL